MNESNGSKYYDCIVEALSLGRVPGNDDQTQLSIRLRCVDDASTKWINYTLDPKYNSRTVENLREVGIDCPDELTPDAARKLVVSKIGVCYVEKMGSDGKERRYLNRPGKAFMNDNVNGAYTADKRTSNRPKQRNTQTPF